MGSISEEKKLHLINKIGDERPNIEHLRDHYAVLLNELMFRIRDRIDNGNVQEVAALIDATQHIDQLSYAIESVNGDKIEHFVNKQGIEEIVDRAVEKVHEKMQGEEKSAVARKLKLNAALAAKAENLTEILDPINAPLKEVKQRVGRDAAPDSLALS